MPGTRSTPGRTPASEVRFGNRGGALGVGSVPELATDPLRLHFDLTSPALAALTSTALIQSQAAILCGSLPPEPAAELLEGLEAGGDLGGDWGRQVRAQALSQVQSQGQAQGRAQGWGQGRAQKLGEGQGLIHMRGQGHVQGGGSQQGQGRGSAGAGEPGPGPGAQQQARRGSHREGKAGGGRGRGLQGVDSTRGLLSASASHAAVSEFVWSVVRHVVPPGLLGNRRNRR